MFSNGSVRIWTVLGGMASVLAVILVIHPIHASPGGASSVGHPVPTYADSGTGRSVPTYRDSGTAPATGSAGTAPTQSSGIWIAQLASISVSAGSAKRQKALDEIMTEIPGAQYLDSSNYASLNPGYWVVYYAGPFSDGNQALRYCATHGRTTRNQCIGRFLSHDVRDKFYMCFPPADGQSTGCTRP